MDSTARGQTPPALPPRPANRAFPRGSPQPARSASAEMWCPQGGGAEIGHRPLGRPWGQGRSGQESEGRQGHFSTHTCITSSPSSHHDDPPRETEAQWLVAECLLPICPPLPPSLTPTPVIRHRHRPMGHREVSPLAMMRVTTQRTVPRVTCWQVWPGCGVGSHWQPNRLPRAKQATGDPSSAFGGPRPKTPLIPYQTPSSLRKPRPPWTPTCSSC